jgi:PAS domain S-box-containing protein
MQAASDDATALFEAIPDPAFRVDSQGTILAANAAGLAEGLTANPPLIGQKIQHTVGTLAAQKIVEALAQVAATGAVQTVECSRTRQGRETHHEARLSPLAGGEVLVLVRDITQRKLDEDALRESDARFRVLADNITDALWIRTPDMRELRYVSRGFERIWGRPTAELYAGPHRWIDFIVPEDREHVVRTFAGLTADAPSLDVEYRILRPDGEQRWIRVRGFQVRDAAGTLLSNTGIVTDITERKLAQAELDAAHKQLMEASRRAGMAEIATNVLHDVGHILNSVTVSAGILRSTLSASRSQGLDLAIRMMNEHADDLGNFLAQDAQGKLLPSYLHGISQALLQEQKALMDELQHLTRSIGHIREVITTQQAYARTSGHRESGRISDLVEDALRINAHALERDGVVVVKEFAALPAVIIDRARVLQVLVNLIGNARDALAHVPPEARRLTARVRGAGAGRVQVSVQDEGEGIPPENLTRIFAHGFTTRKHGHGFGLHSCALAAAEMGGTLTVHSDGPGRGATFALELPVESTEGAP